MQLEILSPELKIRFSETLLRRFLETLLGWESREEAEKLLGRVQADFPSDMVAYIEELSEDLLSERNYQAFEFLKQALANIKDIRNSVIFLKKMEGVIEKFKSSYPDQVELAERLEGFLDFYKEVREDIRRVF